MISFFSQGHKIPWGICDAFRNSFICLTYETLNIHIVCQYINTLIFKMLSQFGAQITVYLIHLYDLMSVLDKGYFGGYYNRVLVRKEVT